MKAGIVVFPGSNCDRDCYRAAVEIMGWDANYLWHREEKDLDKYDLIILPGGFSYGDYLRPGALAALSPLMERIKEFAGRGGYVLGICNGFQVLCELGLLPGALLSNGQQKFICREVFLRVENNAFPFGREYVEGEVLRIPIAHGDGNYFCDSDELQKLEENNQIIFRYCSSRGETGDEFNPNGSVENIAGIKNVRGNILGLMPHPERALEAILHGGSEDGRRLFASLYREVAGR